ncbi:Crp/Fnr family transcriptional regulator [Sporocytophaga myxococcoides]|uniref:Crp/Fnr family transcriptional regulator n=1 Tax=Sporocytophaga myxococcoides TaxID=153721 RepID=UPI0005F0B8DA|nr:cyclic nucleotide-binding domain-containing protein [Sporocytophaga myxococcoides]
MSQDKLKLFLQILEEKGIQISKEDIKTVSEHTRTVSIEKGTTFMKQGVPVKRLYFLISGTVRLYVDHRTHQTTMDFISWNEFVSTFVYVQNEVPSAVALDALTDVTALFWEKDDIIFLKKHTKVFNDIENVMLDALLQWNLQREIDFRNLSPEERYLKLYEIQPRVVQQVPLKYIASYLGIHQDSLSRIRKKIIMKRA